MTFNDLQTTLQSAVASEKIGQPVAFRVHGVIADRSFDVASALDAIVRLSETLFSSRPQRLTARADAEARQWNLLLNFAGGESLLLSVATGQSRPSENCLHLILIGNHGMIRLEGGDAFSHWPQPEPQSVEFWTYRVNESRSQQRSIELGEWPGRIG